MEHSVATLKRISGNTDSDKIIASQFCKEVLAETQKRAESIENICDLEMILDADSFALATNALAGIRHLTSATESVSEFHHEGVLGSTFNDLHARLLNIRETAEGNYRWLCLLFPSAVAN